jgi:hypothetical protein
MDLVRIDDEEEIIASIIRGTRIDGLGTTLAIIVHSHRRENQKSYKDFVYM